MAIATYNHFANGITIRGVPILQAYPGKVFWVNNVATATSAVDPRGITGADSGPGTMLKPYKTIAFAITQCVANRGDIIVCVPGHAETITAAGGITMSKAGVCLLGLGSGTLRPQINYTTANTATMVVTGANCSLKNIAFKGNFLSIACAIDLQAKNCAIEDCDFSDTSAILGFLGAVNPTGAANTADNLWFCDNKVVGLSTASYLTAITSANDIDGAVINRNYVKLTVNNGLTSLILVTAGVLTNLRVLDNMIYRLNTTADTGGSLVSVGGTTSTGIVARNYIQTAQGSTDLVCTTSVGLGFFENRITAVTGATGYVLPAVDS